MLSKRSKVLSVATLILATSVISGIIPSSAAEMSDATVKSYEQQLSEISAKQEEMLKQIEATKNDIEKTRQYKSSIDQSLELTYQKKVTAENMLSELESKIEEKTEQIEQAEKDIGEKKEKFKERMVSLYEDGNASYLSLILGAEDISSFLSRVDNVTSILEYDNQVMDELRESRKELEAAKSELEAAKQTQASTIAELEDTEAYYEQLSNENSNLIASLQSNESELESDYQYYLQAEEQLSNELESYLQELQQKSNMVYVGGEFIWPLNGYTNLSSTFGARTLNGQTDYHQAIDIPAPAGTPIYASNGGEVVASAMHDSYGNYVLINHGGDKATLYAHMTTRMVSVGETVSQGQQIGTVGTTGYSFGNHLHFELRVNGVRTDPMTLFN